jgi:precorrin isomerase
MRCVRRDLPRAGLAAGARPPGGRGGALHRLHGVRRGLPGGRHRHLGVTAAPVHPIEEESYRILAGRVDLSGLPPLARAVTARIIHATADVEFATTVVTDEAALSGAVRALAAGAPVVADVEMVRAGLTGVGARCYLADAAAGAGLTRSAAAVRLAAGAHPSGAVWVIGCAPTALVELVALAGRGLVSPAFVVGLPVGFVGAADSKDQLRRSGLPAVSNIGEKGGSAAAAGALNALVRVARGARR